MRNRGLEVYQDHHELSEAAVHRFAAVAVEAVEKRGRFMVALAGGSTPQGLYRLLGQAPYKTRVPWQRTHILWGDERLVPPDDPGSNYGQVAGTLLDNIDVPSVNIHRARGELSPAGAVDHYKAVLNQLADTGRQWPRLDLAIMGMGSDGHTASLFPGPISTQEAREAVIAVTADYDGRPANRITLTPIVFNDARLILFLVTGAAKSKALKAVLTGPYQPQLWPAQRIRPDRGSIAWLVDSAAAGKLTDA